MGEDFDVFELSDDDFMDNFQDEYMDEGNGFSLDIDVIFILSLTDSIKWNFGLVGQNLPKMDMVDAIDVESQYNFGTALGLSFWKCVLVLAADFHDFTYAFDEDDDPYKRIHMGTKFRLPKIIAIRVGLN